MIARDFTPIADSLRSSVLEFYAERGESLEDPAGTNTLETNSGFVERRATPLLQTLSEITGRDSIEGLRLIDLGCGFGALAVFFAQQGAVVTGIDPIADRLEVGRAVAAEHDLPVEFSQGWMEKLDFADESFDLAIQNNSLCYIVDREGRRSALRETARVLGPGGFVVIRNPNRWHPRDQFTGLPLITLLPPHAATRLAARLGHPRSEVRLVSPLEAKRELRHAGFTEVKLAASPASRWPEFMKPIARYQHLVARKPS
ncbi:MAG TPA: class I SAM-dependent methyltransferase [Solirubrobacterales bacterium]|jgi:ubiquinone/menaquinone biosynthesis C-methylase UbiE|nr:class I SAM-dependent methyltransferase [Solirubrobacterales bacterium]